MRYLLVVTIVALSSYGCGLGIVDFTQGGGDNLPVSGLGAYSKLPADFDSPADEPFLFQSRFDHFRDPTILDRGNDGLRLWFTREERLATAGEAEIWYGEIADTAELPDVAAGLALAPSETWEEGRVRAPSVLRTGPSTLTMYYEGGVTAIGIGRADSTDDGTTWTKHPSNPILDNIGEPGIAAREDGTWLLAYTEEGGSDIFVATSTDGIDWQRPVTPAVSPRSIAEAFDTSNVARPSLTTVNDSGRERFILSFEGNDQSVISIGTAGSFDGVEWQRFNNILATLDSPLTDENGPNILVRSSIAFLVFSETKNNLDRIAIAVSP